MLGFLVKKQLMEIFKSYFYDPKKNTMRSKGRMAGMFILFAFIMLIFGGTFAGLSFGLCISFEPLGLGWLYFIMTGLIAVVIGIFGSVFSTYSGLYLAKDNDLLLALPIPVRTIMASRLVIVYLMGALYSLFVLVPAIAIYWIISGLTAAKLAGGIALILIVTLLVLALSCILGWAVARISLKLKNRSFITVIISILFIAAYYVFVYRVNDLIDTLVENAVTVGDRIRGSAAILYHFGTIGEGGLTAAALFLAATAALCAVIWTVLNRSFIRIVTSTAVTQKVRYVEKAAKLRSPFAALLSKEFARFTSSAGYMLNCGLGVILIPAAGVLLLFKGAEIGEVVDSFLASRPEAFAVLAACALCMVTSMIDVAAPSVSLEGKSVWIPRSLPLDPGLVLRAKAAVQLILTEVPMLFAVVCAAVSLKASLPTKAAAFLLPLAYSAFSSLFSTAVGVRMPMLNWTSELMPMKQGGAVTLSLFSGWIISAALAGLYLLVGYRIGAALYLALCTVLFAALAFALLAWLDRSGGRRFEELS